MQLESSSFFLISFATYLSVLAVLIFSGTYLFTVSLISILNIFPSFSSLSLICWVFFLTFVMAAYIIQFETSFSFDICI